MSQIITKFITDLAITNAKVATGIDAAKIADGSVSNAEFQYLANVTSDIQAQIDAKLDASAAEFADNSFRIQDDGDTTKKLAFEVSAIATATTRTITVPDQNISLSTGIAGTYAERLLSNNNVISVDLASDFFPNFWGSPMPGLVLDGNTLEATTAGAYSLVLDAGPASCELLIGTKEENSASNSNKLRVLTGNNTDTGASGEIEIKTGNSVSEGSGNLSLLTGEALYSGFCNIKTGNATGSFNSGYVVIETGASATGDSGSLSLIVGTAGGTQGQFQFYKSGVPSTVGQVWTATGTNGEGYWANASGGATGGKETFTLAAGDITNQYIDLAQVANTNSIHFIVKGGAPTLEGASHDYSVNYTGGVGGNTRITFLNDLATGGPAALIAGDVVQVVYTY